MHRVSRVLAAAMVLGTVVEPAEATMRGTAWLGILDDPSSEVMVWDDAGHEGSPFARWGLLRASASPASPGYELPGSIDDAPAAGTYDASRSQQKRSYGSMFLRGWAVISSVEIALLAATVAMPREWTGWSDTFVQDAMHNMERAWTSPPVRLRRSCRARTDSGRHTPRSSWPPRAPIL